ncbi:MAG: hypothetical protein A4E19_12590 [Nitrospira sp. SG-bin1]|nr:MAG: hypothetical protein A4E19_12590 [Nitrospira sp. SG-bin1]
MAWQGAGFAQVTLWKYSYHLTESDLLQTMGETIVGIGIRKPMTGTPSPASPSRFLIVTLGRRYLALDVESIAGLLTLDEIGGVTNPTLHGMEYGIIDLADRLSVSHDQNGANTRIVLLSEHGGRGSIRVSTVEGFLELQSSQILPLPTQFQGPEQHWYRGMILFQRSVALVLNIAWVLEGRVPGINGGGGQRSTPGLAA